MNNTKKKLGYKLKILKIWIIWFRRYYKILTVYAGLRPKGSYNCWIEKNPNFGFA